MKIADKTVVQMHYTLTSDEGAVIDSSEGREPLQYIQGTHMIGSVLKKPWSDTKWATSSMSRSFLPKVTANTTKK
jgi:FKBP-type peptidyl-prolyl cis-trans isomerase 2